jgi:type VI secretion system protein ImpA
MLSGFNPMQEAPLVAPQTLDQLLAPIAGDSPAGESLRYEGTYDRIAEARREDDATLTQGVWKSSLKKADWAVIERMCIDELQARTKDLQIAAWLLEAWLHLYGFEGVKEGLDLLHGLVERFWKEIYPQIADGDLEYRTAPITWVNEKLSIQLKLLPLTSPESDDVPAYGWSDWENACRTEVPDPKLTSTAAARQPPKLTLPEFQKSVMFTPTAFFAGLVGELERAMEACTALETSLDHLCGKAAPSLRQFWGVLESAHDLLLSTLAQRLPEETHPALEPPLGVVAVQEAEPPGPVFGSGPITSRDEAYRRLAEAAEYLARIEPHSPAPYLVKRAILWGNLSLPELLPELVRNQSELTEIFRLLQIENMKKPEK